MSKQYEDFKKETIAATTTIDRAKAMRAVSDDFAEGFSKAMWEAREIYMRLEDKSDNERKGAGME